MLEVALLEQVERASVVDVRRAPAGAPRAPSWAKPVTAACVVAEASRQSLELIKVLSVMSVENGRVGEFVRNSNGSYDIGPMQINTIHLRDLSKLFGVPPTAVAQALAWDGCFNVAVGALLLRKRTNEAGGDFWYGIGRYHSKTTQYSNAYILRVHEKMLSIARPPAGRGVTEKR